MDIEAVRRRLLLSIAGTFATSCGPSVPDDGGGSASGSMVDSGTGSMDAGVTSMSSASHSGTSNGGTSTAASTTADAGDSPDPMTYDIGVRPDVFAECPAQPMPPMEECTAELPHPEAYFVFYCVPIPQGGSCETWVESFPKQSWSITECLIEDCTGPDIEAIGCGPLPDSGDQCCFWFIADDGQFCPGRPFVVAGRERLAALVEREDWTTSIPCAAAAPAARPAIAAAWAEQAAFEHASIASFSRFVLQLLACGAPARLLTSAQLALGEEIEHARLFFAFASHYADRPLGPGALATHDALATSDDLDAIVLATVREGCIAETISAWHVTLAAASAREPAMACALARVAEQELEHAALAWAFLAWVLPRASDPLRERIEATLHDAARFAPRGPTLASDVASDAWLAHGILPAEVHASATRHALRELVAPVARSLMNTVPARSSASMVLARPSA